MKTLIFGCVVVFAYLAAGDTATGDHQPDTNQFGRWRSCLTSKLPADKQATMQGCVSRPGGTDMSKFRRGLECVLDSYGVVKDHRVNLQKMSRTAPTVRSAELKKAFQECPRDDKNVSLDRSIKCVIDHLETSCPLDKNRG